MVFNLRFVKSIKAYNILIKFVENITHSFRIFQFINDLGNYLLLHRYLQLQCIIHLVISYILDYILLMVLKLE